MEHKTWCARNTLKVTVESLKICQRGKYIVSTTTDSSNCWLEVKADTPWLCLLSCQQHDNAYIIWKFCTMKSRSFAGGEFHILGDIRNFEQKTSLRTRYGVYVTMLCFYYMLSITLTAVKFFFVGVFQLFSDWCFDWFVFEHSTMTLVFSKTIIIFTEYTVVLWWSFA